MENSELNNKPVDYVTMAAKSALGTVPFVGSLLAELAGNFIPNQRVDRIISFAQELEARLGRIERTVLQAKITTPEGADLIEEAMRQAASSLSVDRQKYIANLIENGLTNSEINDQESKHLLRILGELSDVEIIWLRFYADSGLGGDKEFREKHAEILETERSYIGAPQPSHDKSSLAKSYKLHLARLGLLQERLAIDQKTKLLKIDNQGRTEVKGYTISNLGRLLLRSIGLSDGLN